VRHKRAKKDVCSVQRRREQAALVDLSLEAAIQSSGRTVQRGQRPYSTSSIVQGRRQLCSRSRQIRKPGSRSGQSCNRSGQIRKLGSRSGHISKPGSRSRQLSSRSEQFRQRSGQQIGQPGFAEILILFSVGKFPSLGALVSLKSF
jgi:hypothetical protein